MTNLRKKFCCQRWKAFRSISQIFRKKLVFFRKNHYSPNEFFGHVECIFDKPVGKFFSDAEFFFRSISQITWKLSFIFDEKFLLDDHFRQVWSSFDHYAKNFATKIRYFFVQDPKNKNALNFFSKKNHFFSQRSFVHEKRNSHNHAKSFLTKCWYFLAEVPKMRKKTSEKICPKWSDRHVECSFGRPPEKNSPESLCFFIQCRDMPKKLNSLF